MVLIAFLATNKDELLEMIHHGVDKIVNSKEEYVLGTTYTGVSLLTNRAV
jgi:hypothetical protein